MAAGDEFPIVGVGASAGGVEAMEGFFRDMASDIGMAFVVVTHMPRSHTTALSEIIGRYTKLAVANAQDRERIWTPCEPCRACRSLPPTSTMPRWPSRGVAAIRMP